MNKLVSVIVPVYNVEKYLNECIDSIIKQTYRNIEIILVDDGSTDGSSKICDNYSDYDDRIIVIHKKNEGLGLARNSGLLKASGYYVTFIDSDDLVGEKMIQNLISGIECSYSDACLGGMTRINENGQILFKKDYKNKLFKDKEIINKLFMKQLGSNPGKHDAIKMSVWNNIYSMKIIRENRLRFVSEREYISEDIIWNSDYFKYAKKVQLVKSNEYFYRINPSSLTKKYNKDKFKLVKSLYTKMISKLDELLINDEAYVRLKTQFFINIRACILQEREISLVNRYINIKKILTDDIVRSAIHDYPMKKLNFQQKVFLYLIKYKMVMMMLIANISYR